MNATLTVLKIGGSVLTGPDAYARTAAFIRARLDACRGDAIVAVVSAELGVTDDLLATATRIVARPDPATLDLLWSTGELRSAALLALALQAAGVRAAGINVEQSGLVREGDDARPGDVRVRPLRIRALLDRHDVIVVPGFLATNAGGATVSLGRGGSDLTAVLIAAGLGAARCELLKDVPGYFSADPKLDPGARPLAALSYAGALEMADEGCELVQRQALEAARRYGLPLVITAMGHDGGTRIDAAH